MPMSLHIALRNLLAHKTSTFIVAIIILFGTTLMVVGTSFIDSVNRSMQRAITASVSGHLQVYSSTAEDELALFGGGMGGSANLGQMPSFSAVRDAIESMDEVKAVVPMGMISSTVNSDGNQIDQALASLRLAVDQDDKASQRALTPEHCTRHLGRMERAYQAHSRYRKANSRARASQPAQLRELPVRV